MTATRISFVRRWSRLASLTAASFLIASVLGSQVGQTAWCLFFAEAWDGRTCTTGAAGGSWLCPGNCISNPIDANGCKVDDTCVPR